MAMDGSQLTKKETAGQEKWMETVEGLLEDDGETKGNGIAVRVQLASGVCS
jgi:hypothetical protein